MHIVNGCFLATMGWVAIAERRSLAPKVKNICYLALYRPSFFTPVTDEPQFIYPLEFWWALIYFQVRRLCSEKHCSPHFPLCSLHLVRQDPSRGATEQREIHGLRCMSCQLPSHRWDQFTLIQEFRGACLSTHLKRITSYLSKFHGSYCPHLCFIYLFIKKRDLKIQKVSLLQVNSYSLWGAKSGFTPKQLGLVLFLKPPGSHISFNSNV